MLFAEEMGFTGYWVFDVTKIKHFLSEDRQKRTIVRQFLNGCQMVSSSLDPGSRPCGYRRCYEEEATINRRQYSVFFIAMVGFWFVTTKRSKHAWNLTMGSDLYRSPPPVTITVIDMSSTATYSSVRPTEPFIWIKYRRNAGRIGSSIRLKQGQAWRNQQISTIA